MAAEITVAAVDEGIHSILGYDNPDPYTFFQRSRQMLVQQAHYYDKVFYEPEESAAAAYDATAGLTAGGRKLDPPVACGRGIVRSDAAGRAVVTFDVPIHRAVAVSGGGCDRANVGGPRFPWS